jgi:predicted phosphodiesterase
MRIAVLSDLHLEFVDFDPPAELHAADVVVLAGDIHNGVAALHWARDRFPDQAIVQVAGNHEFFGDCWHSLVTEMRRVARRLDIRLLENEAVVCEGVQFLGATLWTDYELFTVASRPLQMHPSAAMAMMQRRMLDYSHIRWHDRGERLLTPSDTVAIHRASRAWLAGELARPFAGPRVVVTHHLPSWRSVAPRFLRAPSNAAFASDLDALFDPVTLWIHGHTHHSFDYRAGRTRVVANPRGYLLADGDFENPGFRPDLIVDLDDPAGFGD